MDNIFHPEHRKWMSPLTNLGNSMADLKGLVQLKKDTLVVINPTGMNGSGHAFSSEMPFSGFKQEGSSSATATSPEYMNNTDFDETCDFDVEEESSRIRETLEISKQRKWAEGDEVCEAAVAAVKGPRFFSLKKIPKKKKGGRKGKQAKSKEGGTSSESELDFDWEKEEACTSTSVQDMPGVLSTEMYEKFNYEGDHPAEEEDDSELGSNIDEEALQSISKMVPDVLNESDSDGNEFDFDDDDNNFVGGADRYAIYKERYKELLHSDSEDDEQEQYYTSEDDYENEEKSEEGSQEDVDALPTPSTSFAACVPGPSKSILKRSESGRRKRKKQRKSVRLAISGDTNCNNLIHMSDIKKEPGGCDTEEKVTNTAGGTENCEQEDISVTDFKRFIDWAFKQTKRKECDQKEFSCPALMEKMNMSTKDVRNLQNVASATLTTVKGEGFQDEAVIKSSSMPLLAPPIEKPPKTNLQSLAIFITHGEDPSCFPWKSVNVQQQINDDFAYDEFVKRMEQQKLDVRNPAMKDELVDKEDDFLVQILFYQATDPDDVLPDEVKMRRRHDDEGDIINQYGGGRRRKIGFGDTVCNSVGGPNRYIEPKLAYEFHMLGSQTVGDLTRALRCENDTVYLEDVPHPDQFTENPQHYAKNKFPSAMTLIHDTIYSDPKTSEVDYAAVINEWAKRPPEKNIGPFKRGDPSTKLKDLNIRFGYPYVYIHLGGCEHILVFTKARLLHVEDEHLKRNYPKVIGMTRFKNVYCRVDNEYLARWAVSDYKEFPENPMLLCTECVLMYCYDKHKNKRGNFKLYPFTQMANIL